MTRRADILNARHLVATANGNVLQASGAIARALAWQLGDEASLITNLETALELLASSQRQLHEAITEVRVATREE